MANYRTTSLNLQTRVKLGFQMADPERSWGEATRLAEEYQVSRKTLYHWGAKTRAAVEATLAPGRPGRPTEQNGELERATLVLATIVPGSVRTIQQTLGLLFQQHRSVGWISQVLQRAGAEAKRNALELSLPIEVLGEADEIFQGRRPCLTVVDGKSFLVLNSSLAEHRDALTWGCTFLDLEKQGVRFRDLAADGARGISAGLAAAGIAVPVHLDRFHALREGSRVTQRLERRAYGALDTEFRAWRAHQEALQGQQRRGKPLKVTVPLAEAQAQAQEAVSHYEAWCYLWSEMQRVLEPWDGQGQLTDPDGARQTLETAAELLLTLPLPAVTAWVKGYLLPHVEDLLAAQVALTQALQPWRETLRKADLNFILWVWQFREALDLTQLEGAFEPELVSAAQQIWDLLVWFHRASSLAESFHSWLRPYLQVHRGVPQWLLPLLQLVWNHHVFSRGKRKGASPMELAGLADVPSLAELFERLLNPPISARG